MIGVPGRCAACGGLVDEEDLFCANCGTEVPTAHAERPARVAVAARNFECRGCGATMNYDAAARSLKCPFCGSVDLVEEPGRGLPEPEFVIPMVLDRGAAEDHLRRWLAAGFWRPNDLAGAAAVEDLRAAYLPFWVVATHVRTHWTADWGNSGVATHSGWYPAAGFREADYAGLWVPAGGAIAAEELEAILPFDTDAAVGPEGIDLEHATVEQFAVTRRYARPLAQERLERREAEAVTAELGRARNVHVNVLMSGAESRAALAPVYVMAYRYRGKIYRFLANGQTGRATGRAPVSLAKVAGAVAAVALAIALIVGIILLATGRF